MGSDCISSWSLLIFLLYSISLYEDPTMTRYGSYDRINLIDSMCGLVCYKRANW